MENGIYRKMGWPWVHPWLYFWLIFGCICLKEFLIRKRWPSPNNKKKQLKFVQNAVKYLFGTVKVLNVKNVRTGLMQKVKTPVTTNTKNW